MSADLWMPLIGWTVPTSLSLECSADGVSWSAITITAGWYGFRAFSVSTTGDRTLWGAASTSLAGAIAVAVDAALGGSAVTGQYRTGMGTNRLAWRIQRGTASTYLRGTLSVMQSIGLSTAEYLFRGTSDILETWSDRNFLGVFGPQSDSGFVLPFDNVGTEKKKSVFNNAVYQVTRFAQTNTVRAEWRNSPTRYVNSRWAERSIYALVAGTSVEDTQNTLARFLDAAARKYAMILYQDNTSADGILVAPDFTSNLRQEDFATAIDSFRKHNFTIPFDVL